MRIKCIFHSEKIPIAYDMMFVSFIKSCLESSDPDYFQNLYYYHDRRNKKSKNFTYSVFLRDYELREDHFLIHGHLELYISSPDREWMLHFYNGLLKNLHFTYKNYKLKKSRVMMVKEDLIGGDIAVFSTMSPLYVKDRQNRSLSPEQPEFEQELNYISNVILRNYRNYPLMKPLKFQPISMKKVVVKKAVSLQQTLEDEKYLHLEGHKGSFVLEGDREDLNDLYQMGLGFRRSSGMGMIRVITS